MGDNISVVDGNMLWDAAICNYIIISSYIQLINNNNVFPL